MGFGVGHGVMYGGSEWEMPCTDDLAMLFTTMPSFKRKGAGGGTETDVEGFKTKAYAEAFGRQIEGEFDCERDDIRGGERNLEGVTTPVIPNEKDGEGKREFKSSLGEIEDLVYDAKEEEE